MAVNPTRMNLINTRKRMALAGKGYSLLKKKREALVIEFFKMLKQSSSDRERLYQMLQAAYKTTVLASTFAGDFELEQASLYVSDASGVSVGIKNVMGVRIPEIEDIQKQQKPQTFFQSSTAVSDVSDAFSGVKETIIDTAKREQSLRRLILEIDKVKRRVNALEYILIPKLKKEGSYISFRLEEMERDTFSALKHVKKKLEKGENEQRLPV
ncbi:MAG: V-type ATP synthase subunit D [Candidatus Micrarchaeota archaeon]|nr:V-type ATP synthase subunit D [Candidatus Micrarchaeota archaeon]